MMRTKTIKVTDINGRKHVYTLPEYRSSLFDGGINDAYLLLFILAAAEVLAHVI